jgi:hypothetical protein
MARYKMDEGKKERAVKGSRYKRNDSPLNFNGHFHKYT